MIIASRVPLQYIFVTGTGQSDFGPGTDPWETAAYDIALQNAGIENANILKYTSVMPRDATQISIEEAHAQGLMIHGMALETIMAEQTGSKDEHVCAGVGISRVYKDDKYIGGFAAEYEGHGSPETAEEEIRAALLGIFTRRYGAEAAHGDTPGYRYEVAEVRTADVHIDKNFGCALAAICFVSFDLPVLNAGVLP